MELLQTLINGVLTGFVYGVVALSFVVIYRASRIVNLAQGQVVMVSAFFVWLFVLHLAWPVWIGLPAALAASICLGALIERAVFRRLIGQPVFSVVMASIGLLILIQGSAQLLFGAQTRPFPQVLPAGAWAVGPLLLNKALLIGAVLTLVTTEALHRFFTNTRAGLRLAAVAEDHVTAMSLGVSVQRATAIAWMLGTALALMAAVILLSGTVLGLQAAEIGLRALPVALLGGLESVRGAGLAGVLIGVGEALASRFLDPYTAGAASQVFPYVLMILVLLVRPQGLFGWKKIERL
ncbi:branched-chain amino acid ABC transporter permease [Hydrogenophaga sp.]|jgi:branched-chain amino acid transport system permease protein|uniref:branched-chain amino acid ABC transporter permease n=1 Tax=Hydrogenophaga sp. TaxID=1904254 RepID=UPI003F72F6EB